MSVAKALVLLQLSLLFVSSFSDELDGQLTAIPPAHPPHHPHPHPPAQAPGHHHHHHHHSPAEAPHHHRRHHGLPPAHSPVHPPAHPPGFGPHTPKPAPVPVHPPKPSPPKPSPPKSSPPKPYPPKPSPPKPTPPVHPPKASPPVHPPKPAPGPAHPPHKPFPRAFVAVQGVVYCKSCKYPGVDTLLGASPLLGAVVSLHCNNTKYPAVIEGKTDKNGYFYLTAPKKGPKIVTSYGAHKCCVKLGPSPLATCNKPSMLHGGASCASLKPEKFDVAKNLMVYTVGPLAFEPKCH